MFAYIAFGIGAIVLIGYGIFYYKQMAGIKKIQDQVKYSYDSYSKTLTIYSQDPNFAKLLVSRRHQTKKYTDIPEKYIYTSATVGGITTGGVTKVGGYTDVDEYNTSRYELILQTFKGATNGHKEGILERVVKKIYLSGDIHEKAENSDIADYIEKRHIVVVEDVEIPSHVAHMSTSQAATMLEVYESLGYPSKEKCDAILDWVCAKNQPSSNEEGDDYKEISNAREDIKGWKLVTIILSVMLTLVTAIFSFAIFPNFKGVWPIIWTVILSIIALLIICGIIITLIAFIRTSTPQKIKKEKRNAVLISVTAIMLSLLLSVSFPFLKYYVFFQGFREGDYSEHTCDEFSCHNSADGGCWIVKNHPTSYYCKKHFAQNAERWG